MDTLFLFGVTHAFCKLRCHLEDTVTALEGFINALGTHVRKFASATCRYYDTRELPREVTRGRKKPRLDKGKGKAAGPAAPGKKKT